MTNGKLKHRANAALRRVMITGWLLAFVVGASFGGVSPVAAAEKEPLARLSAYRLPDGDSITGAVLTQSLEPSSSTPVALTDGDAQMVAEAIHLTNLERAKAGLLPLKADSSLGTSASGHSADMATNDFFNHTGSGGTTLVNRFVAANYLNWTAGGENIAAGFATAAQVVAAWMNSPGHRNNILHPSYREIGIGFVHQTSDQANVRLPDGSLGGPYFYYWTQDFGARFNVYPIIVNLEAPSTSDRNVSLAIHGAGWAAQMMIANDASFAGATWLPYSSQQAWTLAAGNGLRTVYVKLRSTYGQELVATDTIELTGQPPDPGENLLPPKVKINAGQPLTNSPRIILSLELPSQARTLEVSRSSDFGVAVLLPVGTQADWLLEADRPGQQEVHVRYRDAYGRTSPAASASILFDPLPPVGSVKVLADYGWTVQVGLEAWDPHSGVDVMAVGLVVEELVWQPFQPVLKIAVPGAIQAGGVTPVVYARFRDAAGNVSGLFRSDDSGSALVRTFLPLLTESR